jgi:hypothetical protein
VPENVRARASNHPILIVNTRVEARGLALRVKETLLARGCDVQMWGGAVPNAKRPPGNEGLSFGEVKGRLFRSLLMRSVALTWRIVVDRVKLSKSLQEIQPVAIVIFDDRPLTPNYLLRVLALRRDIPVVLIPFAVSTLESDVKLREGRSAHVLGVPPGRMFKRVIARWWPRQAYAVSGRTFLFHNVWDTAALIFCGALPQNPWYVGGSHPELVCAAGDDQRDYFLEAGVFADRIALTGPPLLDESVGSREAAGAIRRALVVKYTLTGERALIICAVPQYAEHGLLDWDSHIKLTEELFSTLAGSGASVLLSLHPKSQRSVYEESAATYGLSILEERLADVMVAADLLVGTFSSTVGWAVGLGIPAFVAATIHADYQLYRDIPGVVVVDDHAALAENLARFVGDQDFRRKLAADTGRGADRVGRLDGKAGERVAAAIEQMVISRAKVSMSGNCNVG